MRKVFKDRAVQVLVNELLGFSKNGYISFMSSFIFFTKCMYRSENQILYCSVCMYILVSLVFWHKIAIYHLIVMDNGKCLISSDPTKENSNISSIL